MGPKVKFTKEQIIDTALNSSDRRIRQYNHEKNRRKIGQFSCPIYVNFKNVDELNEALIERIMSISGQL